MIKRYLKKIGFLITILLFVIYAVPIPILAFGPSSDTIYQGIDVSIYQGEIDFEKVKKEGIEIVYIRSGEGSDYVDAYFERNYREAKKHGLKVGFYHYVTARSEEEAKRQARFFAKTVAGKSPDCRLAMDFESFGNLSKNEVNELGLIFMQTLEKLSKKEVILYSNAYSARTIWDERVNSYPLWVAEYEVDKPEEVGTWKTWAGWQYTDRGRINGIEGNVDKDKFTKEVLLSDNGPINPDDPDNPDDGKTTKTITIQKGDTLSKIAVQYETTIEKLIELNHIENPNLIYAGDALIVPGKEESESSDNQIYIVKKGDTLAQIAIMFNTSVQTIAKDNRIQDVNLIYPGQRLVVRRNYYYHSKIANTKAYQSLWNMAKSNHTSIANMIRSKVR